MSTYYAALSDRLLVGCVWTERLTGHTLECVAADEYDRIPRGIAVV